MPRIDQPLTRLPFIPADAPPTWFPPVEEALSEPAGLLAVGGDLSPERLATAYERGIFPWYGEGEPILWWSPDPREVLLPAEFHCSRSLSRRLRRGEFRLTRDTAFEEVISECARLRRDGPGTWITDDMRAAYTLLHRRGRAHSFEAWRGDELVGGLYGVRSGRVFCGESMFSKVDDASKAALAALVQACPALGIALIDCQMPSSHLRSLGSRPMPRSQFLQYLGAGNPVPAPPPAPETAPGE